MEDIIACGFDAKHSYEDKITPIWEFKRKWGDRIAVIGGFDMHKLCVFDQTEIKAHTGFLFEQCKPGGGFAFGKGNTVADYIPVENFVTMMKEGFSLGRYS